MKTQNLSSHSTQRGVALVVVLSVLLLMSALLVAFMGRVSTERSSQRATLATFEAKQAYESAVNLVISQIREATKDDSGDVGWASQPGVIRTFDNKGKDLKVYKLYSQELMQVSASNYRPAQTNESGFDPSDPTNAPNSSYVNINEPAFTPVAGDPDKVQPHYPIVDPYARKDYSASAQGSEPTQPGRGSIQGFYCTNILHKSNARDKDGNRVLDLPMRVKWLYHMKDGTVSAMNDSGVINGASKENPPIARVAFWTDDESAKLNLNTAAENTYWDVPAVSNLQDSGRINGNAELSYNPDSLHLAASQPARDEFQRYPGHPATTCLSPALRWIFPSNFSDKQYKEALFRLLPRITGGVGTSISGTQNSWRLYFNPTTGIRINNVDPRVAERDRLFASIDEFWFRPDRSQLSDKGIYSVFRDPAKELNPGPATQDALVPDMTKRFGITPASAIERMRFFLTAVSRSSDLNLYGKPRIPVWSMADQQVPQPLGSDKRSVFDDLIAFCSTVGGKNYYFTRAKSWDPYYDFETAGRARPKDATPNSRNKRIFEYLQDLTSKAAPGTDTSFLSKYNADRDQILTEIFDYIRSTNLIDTGNKAQSLPFPPTTFTPYPFAYTPGYDNLQEADINKYNGNTKPNLGSGQVIPIIRKEGDAKVNRGFGRFVTISEAALAFFIDESPDIPGFDIPQSPGAKDVPIRAVLLTEMYTPSPGYPALSEGYAYTVSTPPPLQPNDPVLAFEPADPTKTPIEMQIARGDANYVEIDPWRGQDGRFFMPTRGFTNHFRYDANANGTSRTNKVFFANNTHTNPLPNGDYSRYPFFSRKFYVANSNPANAPTTFKFRGGRIKYEIYSLAVPDSNLPPNFPPFHPRAGERVQEVTVEFPSVVAVPLPTRFTSGQPQSVPGAIEILRTTPNAAPGSTDWDKFAVRSVELNGGPSGGAAPKADIRLAMARYDVPASFYTPAGLPGAYAGTRKQVHNFRSSWGRGYSNASTPPGGTPKYNGSGEEAPGVLVLGQKHRDKFIDLPQSFTAGVPSAGPGAPYGDFDRGMSKHTDGPFINKADEGNVRFDADDDITNGGAVPYFRGGNGYDETGSNFFSPNRIMPSAVMLGSLPSGVKSGRPWETLLFAPPLASTHMGTRSPADHYLLDLFTMPVVEPYSVSEPLATAGRVNLNVRIAPFGYTKDSKGRSYIERNTALLGVFKGMYQLSVPNAIEQSGHSEGPWTSSVAGNKYRYPVDPFGTVEMSILPKFDSNPGYFRSPTQICEIDLLLDHKPPFGIPSASGLKFDDPSKRAAWWAAHGMTGDQNRERPYAHIYPRLTTKSNTYTVHAWAQSIAKNPSTPNDKWGTFDESVDRVLGEYRGSSTIERFLDPNDEAVLAANYDAVDANSKGLDPYYRFRIVNHKRFIVQ